MIKENTRFIDSCIFEGMTSIRAIIKAMDGKISDRRIEKIFYDKNKIAKNAKIIGYLKAVSSQYGFNVEETTSEQIEMITLGTSHGGIIAKATHRTIPLLDNNSNIKSNGFYVMIEGIEDPYNFGYALRSLYPCGCDGIILPKRNWMSAAGVVSRSSAGASELFEMFSANATDAADFFKKLGYKIICADENTDNVLGQCEIPSPTLLIIGGEKRGISSTLMEKADMLIKIGYSREFRASLSAASATTMFAYEIMRQKQQKELKTQFLT